MSWHMDVCKITPKGNISPECDEYLHKHHEDDSWHYEDLRTGNKAQNVYLLDLKFVNQFTEKLHRVWSNHLQKIYPFISVLNVCNKNSYRQTMHVTSYKLIWHLPIKSHRGHIEIWITQKGNNDTRRTFVSRTFLLQPFWRRLNWKMLLMQTLIGEL